MFLLFSFCSGFLFRKKEVFFYQFLFLFCFSLFRFSVQKHFFFNFFCYLLFFSVYFLKKLKKTSLLQNREVFFKISYASYFFLCLGSLFRNKEVFFFSYFLCYLSFFFVLVLCLEKEKSFFFQFLMLFFDFL